MNKIFAIVSFSTIGAAVGAGIGFAAYWFIKHNASIPKLPGTKENLGDPKFYEPPKWLPNLEIAQYPDKIVSGELQFYYSEDQINELISRFVTEANFGPEIFNLDKIVINDYETMGNKGANGLYYPDTNELFLLSDDSNISPQLSADEKLEITYEVLYHEYGHHLFYTYVMSPFPTSNIEEFSTIYELNDYSHVNKDFYNWFVDSFDYNDASLDNAGNAMLNCNAPYCYPAISDNYSMNDLFLNANSYSNNINTENVYGFYQNVDSSKSKYNQRLSGTYLISDKDSLTYLYSLTELLTRKFELSTMSVSNEAKHLTYPGYYESNDFANQLSISFSTIYEDYSRYNSLYYDSSEVFSSFGDTKISQYQWQNELENVTSGGSSNILYEQQYFSDNPFNVTPNLDDDSTKKVAQDFAEQVGTMMGAMNNRELSLLTPKNSTIVKNGFLLAEDDWTNYDANKLLLSGYLDDSIGNILLNLTGDAYLAIKNDDGSFAPIDKIIVKQKNIVYKNNPFDELTNPINNASNIFWSTSNYVNAYNIEEKELYFIYGDDINNPSTYKLSSYRGQDATNEGYASSWLNSYPDDKQTYAKVWGVESSPNNGVMIKNIGNYENISY